MFSNNLTEKDPMPQKKIKHSDGPQEDNLVFWMQLDQSS